MSSGEAAPVFPPPTPQPSSETRGARGASNDTRAADLVAAGLEAALNTRAPGLHSSTPTVRKLAVRICRQLNLDDDAQQLADLSARVRDVGMLGVPDTVILAPGPLSPEQWKLINHHPVIGAQLLASLPGMGRASEVVQAHHERWDGDGYPTGRRGEAIPLLSRVIATADAFVALATDRPHRRAVGSDVALEHLCQQRGSQLDPRTVDALTEVLGGVAAAGGDTRGQHRSTPSVNEPPAAPRHRHKRSNLTDVLASFDVLPVFEPAYDKAITAADSEAPGGELVMAIENDTGLTVAVLRRAQTLSGKRTIASVPDAVAALSTSEIKAAITEPPRVAFPWQTSREALIHELRIHGQNVARAADRIARHTGLEDRDDLITAALLHDLGKLVTAQARPDPARGADTKTSPPEQRVRNEQRQLSLDHAALGALLIKRWGLPDVLSSTVAAHHISESSDDVATLLRLADMVARQAHGDTVDRRVMLRLANAVQLPIPELRDVLFDLPHSGSQRRRAEPSPLSGRETAVLRQLADGKVYKDIAIELGVSASTIRTHLSNVYVKLHVDDRAQAVLRATEMVWI
jgi:putative nucleotidyltransferase with HDIG domain